jgi:hypothetical protein
MPQQKATAEPTVMDDDELLDSTVELIRAYSAIKDPAKRKEIRDLALYLAQGGKIQ